MSSGAYLACVFALSLFRCRENIYSGVEAQFSTLTSLGRVSPDPLSWTEALAGLIRLWYFRSPKSVPILNCYDLPNQVFPINCDCFYICTVSSCQTLYTWCSATQSGKATRNTRESAHSWTYDGGEGRCTSYFKMSFSSCSQASLRKQAPGLCQEASCLSFLYLNLI